MICLVTHIFPKNKDDIYGIFVKKNADSIFQHSNGNIIILNPIPIHKFFSFYFRRDKSFNYRDLNPIYFSFPAKYFKNKTVRFIMSWLTLMSFTLSCRFSLIFLSQKISIFFGHFLYLGGMSATIIGKYQNKNVYIFNGEDSFWSTKAIGKKYTEKILTDCNGFIFPSTYRVNEFKSYFKTLRLRKYIVLPNAARLETFYKRNKNACRKKLFIPQNEFVIIFVGSFDTRKGVDRVIKAVQLARSTFSIFIGKGEIYVPPNKNRIVKLVRNENLPTYYSAADVFVFPSRSEGSPNALIEAISCGLPIICSNKPFLNDLVDETNSIRINENCVNEIEKSIIFLRDNVVFRNKLSSGSIKKAKSFSIETRTLKLLNFGTLKL